MWQNIDLSSLVAPALADSGKVHFDLSAWLGGWRDQDDHVLVTLSFFDETKEAMSNSTGLQAVLAADRNYTTSLIYRETSGAIPFGTRSVQMQVVMIRVGEGPMNDGYVDNISLKLYQ